MPSWPPEQTITPFVLDTPADPPSPTTAAAAAITDITHRQAAADCDRELDRKRDHRLSLSPSLASTRASSLFSSPSLRFRLFDRTRSHPGSMASSPLAPPPARQTALLTLRLSSQSFLDAVITDAATKAPLYLSETVRDLTTLYRLDAGAATRAARVRWPPRVERRGRSGREVQLGDGAWRSAEDFLRPNSLGNVATRKFEIPQYPHTLKWKIVPGNAYHCTTPALKTPLAILDMPPHGSPKLRILHSLIPVASPTGSSSSSPASVAASHAGIALHVLEHLLASALLLVTGVQEWLDRPATAGVARGLEEYELAGFDIAGREMGARSRALATLAVGDTPHRDRGTETRREGKAALRDVPPSAAKLLGLGLGISVGKKSLEEGRDAQSGEDSEAVRRWLETVQASSEDGESPIEPPLPPTPPPTSTEHPEPGKQPAKRTKAKEVRDERAPAYSPAPAYPDSRARSPAPAYPLSPASSSHTHAHSFAHSPAPAYVPDDVQSLWSGPTSASGSTPHSQRTPASSSAPGTRQQPYAFTVTNLAPPPPPPPLSITGGSVHSSPGPLFLDSPASSNAPNPGPLFSAHVQHTQAYVQAQVPPSPGTSAGPTPASTAQSVRWPARPRTAPSSVGLGLGTPGQTQAQGPSPPARRPLPKPPVPALGAQTQPIPPPPPLPMQPLQTQNTHASNQQPWPGAPPTPHTRSFSSPLAYPPPPGPTTFSPPNVSAALPPSPGPHTHSQQPPPTPGGVHSPRPPLPALPGTPTFPPGTSEGSAHTPAHTYFTPDFAYAAPDTLSPDHAHRPEYAQRLLTSPPGTAASLPGTATSMSPPNTADTSPLPPGSGRARARTSLRPVRRTVPPPAPPPAHAMPLPPPHAPSVSREEMLRRRDTAGQWSVRAVVEGEGGEPESPGVPPVPPVPPLPSAPESPSAPQLSSPWSSAPAPAPPTQAQAQARLGVPAHVQDMERRGSYAETVYELPPPAYDAIDWTLPAPNQNALGVRTEGR
ncbi:hypothetical protein CERSUDRAFT_94651 [Gelatoporia subvermispora B]|uniref:Uncharacterized protein n=1 Tax=Ceriporiopsis subvermispora (strain B) TaxID=914234 RepID=M2QKU8_CERS8|nr:hypothetical protein CERSUDRAFT_94651 [Gelatoporia subvermispora B]